MFVEVQSSWFQVVSFHHTFVEALLFNLTFFCFLFFLFSFFSSYILLWNSSIGASFFYVSASCSFYLSWIRSILLSLCNISSWNLLLILLSSSKRSSNVLRRVSSSFILFSWSNHDTHFWLFITSGTLYWFSSLLLQNPPYFILPFEISIVLHSFNRLLTVMFFLLQLNNYDSNLRL